MQPTSDQQNKRKNLLFKNIPTKFGSSGFRENAYKDNPM